MSIFSVKGDALHGARNWTPKLPNQERFSITATAGCVLRTVSGPSPQYTA